MLSAHRTSASVRHALASACLLACALNAAARSAVRSTASSCCRARMFSGRQNAAAPVEEGSIGRYARQTATRGSSGPSPPSFNTRRSSSASLTSSGSSWPSSKTRTVSRHGTATSTSPGAMRAVATSPRPHDVSRRSSFVGPGGTARRRARASLETACARPRGASAARRTAAATGRTTGASRDDGRDESSDGDPTTTRDGDARRRRARRPRRTAAPRRRAPGGGRRRGEPARACRRPDAAARGRVWRPKRAVGDGGGAYLDNETHRRAWSQLAVPSRCRTPGRTDGAARRFATPPSRPGGAFIGIFRP